MNEFNKAITQKLKKKKTCHDLTKAEREAVSLQKQTFKEEFAGLVEHRAKKVISLSKSSASRWSYDHFLEV